MQNDTPYYIALAQFPRFGPITFKKLHAYFPSMEAAFKASEEELVLAGISKKDAANFVHLRKDIQPEALFERAIRLGFRVITQADTEYSTLLKNIYDPPAILFIQGNLPSTEIAHLAVVGSRKSTVYGQEAVRMLIPPLAEAGIVTVSGLAFGIDESAHLETVRAGGITVAVMGGGLMRITGRERHTADKIIESGGAVISEFPLDMPAGKHTFPLRNRIVSGMSHGTLVVEAAEKSGSLITARAALEQGREVFAVPGPITAETSYGTNQLLKMGAHPATTAEDILDILNVHYAPRIVKKPTADTKEEALLLEHLSKTPVHIDELTRKTQLAAREIAGSLALMEMKGKVRQIGGMYYILV
jgi:DNA processing protein